MLAHGCDVEDIMECVVPGRAANTRVETLCREEGKAERCNEKTRMLLLLFKAARILGLCPSGGL